MGARSRRELQQLAMQGPQAAPSRGASLFWDTAMQDLSGVHSLVVCPQAAMLPLLLHICICVCSKRHCAHPKVTMHACRVCWALDCRRVCTWVACQALEGWERAELHSVMAAFMVLASHDVRHDLSCAQCDILPAC